MLRLDVAADELAGAGSWDDVLRGRVREIRLSAGNIAPDTLALLACFPHLESLSLGRVPLDPELLPALPGLASLQHLDISGHAISGAEAESLARLTQLRSLVLEDALLRAEALEPLAGLTALRSLSLSGSEVQGSWLRIVAKMAHLEELRFPVAVRGSELALLARMPSLRVLWLRETLLEGGLPVMLRSVAPELRLLALPPDLDEGAAHRLEGLAHLQHLIHEPPSLAAPATTVIASLPELRSAILGPPADGAAGEALARAACLERLHLAPAPVAPETFATLAGLTSLRTLHIGSPLLTDESSGGLDVPGGLRRLHVISSSLTPEGLHHLQARMPDVEVTHTPHWIKLAGLPREGTLYARPVGRYGEEDWKPLAVTRHGLAADAFSQLSYRQSGGGFSGIHLLQGAAPLQLVEMRFRAVAPDEVDPLILAPFRHLQTLELTHCDVTPRLLAALARPPALRKLVMDFTGLSDAMAGGVGQLPRLECLHVRATRLTGEGLEALAHSATLREVNAEGCDCKPADAASLRERFPRIVWKGLPE